ncbi:hypothetical protein TSUD_262870 [Trifolium subterraneum]|nr:hypothetical protein TSUD_262870 [Trifolium subterraneum]
MSSRNNQHRINRNRFDFERQLQSIPGPTSRPNTQTGAASRAMRSASNNRHIQGLDLHNTHTSAVSRAVLSTSSRNIQGLDLHSTHTGAVSRAVISNRNTHGQNHRTSYSNTVTNAAVSRQNRRY